MYTITVPYGGCSVGAGDWDSDGDVDLAVPSGGAPHTVSILENDGSGGLAAVLTLDLRDPCHVTAGDWDADGDPDLAVASLSGDAVSTFRNTSTPPPPVAFTRITSGAIVSDEGDSSGACWGDYSRDSRLDLFVTNWAGESNFLYRSNGDGTFEKITEGPIVSDGGWSRGCSWGDYDSDGYLDLFVSNDGSGNFLYHNSGDGTFERIMDAPIASDGGNC